jgi:hypothetical protein
MTMEKGYGGNGHASLGSSETFQHAKVMVDEAKAFGRSLSESANGLSAAVDLRGRILRNPLGMMAAGFGIGYLLGGGLFTPLTKKLVRVGLRVAILPLVRGPLMTMAGAAAASAQSGGGSSPAQSGAV